MQMLKILKNTYIPAAFYKSKAESIVGMAQRILSDFDGKVPDTIEELITLPGVGRKQQI